MIEIVSATRLSEADFWEKSALGQSLRRMNFESRISCAIAYENTAGLPELYNSIINEESGAEIILFIHDDVWIDDFFLTERVIEAAQKYDVFGVVGNKKCKHLQPSWAFLDTHGTWDKKENFSGAIAHGSNPFGAISYFGPAPESCKILDGVFIGINKKRVRAAKVFFDKQFNFHFYDVDFCQEAIKKDLKIGTWPIALTHQSTGGYDEKWRENYFHYHEKWKLSNVDENQNSELENNEFIKDNRQTPAHNLINHELMEMIPADTTHIIDVGCMHGQMARIYKEINKNIIYTGIEIDQDYANQALKNCDNVICGDIEQLTSKQWKQLFPSDCWIFGDCLEHLKNPWEILQKIRKHIDKNGCVLVCIPNAQHWAVQFQLYSGNFFYQDSGLLDRTHLRWFTRLTILELFQVTGWKVSEALSRTLGSSNLDNEPRIKAIYNFAAACGLDSDLAVQDATPFQYMFKLIPD